MLGKWWAIHRRTLPLLVLPALAGLFVAAASPDEPSWMPGRLLAQRQPPTTLDRVIAGFLPSVFLLAHAAATTSIGLALATWFGRTGRAVAASVTVFVVLSIGWLVAVMAVIRPLLNWWSMHVERIPEKTFFTLEQALLALSPPGGQATPLDILTRGWNVQRNFAWKVLLLDLVFLLVVTAFLLGLTLLTFNRCLGRMNESPELSRLVRKWQRDRRHADPVLQAAEVT